MKRRSAFTLIELLIVVAIIGILAAIAVPNFLNAQLRAKIARTYSDLKAISTAQEMYYADKNFYAPAFQLHHLTTPVAYIASIPQDVFAPNWEKSLQGEAGAKVTWYRYVYGTTDARVGGSQGLRDAHCADFYAYFPPFALRDAAMSLAQRLGCPTVWLVKSFGPNIGTGVDLCGMDGDDCTFRYDMTNGLRSIGDLAVFGPGGMIQ